MSSRKAKKAPAKSRRNQEKVADKDGTIGWRANALPLKLSPEDLGLLDNVMTVTPVLRIVAAIGQEARRRGLTYPISAVADLQSRLGSDSLSFADHRVDADAIARTMPESWFPIPHEGEFLSRVHLALLRCEMEAALLAPRPVLRGR